MGAVAGLVVITPAAGFAANGLRSLCYSLNSFTGVIYTGFGGCRVVVPVFYLEEMSDDCVYKIGRLQLCTDNHVVHCLK